MWLSLPTPQCCPFYSLSMVYLLLHLDGIWRLLMKNIWLATHKRTLQSFYDNYSNNDKGCKHLLLINVDPGNIIPDELHLLLRITDVLISNLISAAKTDDTKHKKNCKLLDGPMVNSVINKMRSCGINFNAWITEKGFDYTSLMGDSKKALLQKLPSKSLHCQPRRFASDVQRLWEVIILMTVWLCKKFCWFRRIFMIYMPC